MFAKLTLSDEGPGIQGFQITGEAKLGGKLLGCGYPVRGTSLCMFQVKVDLLPLEIMLDIYPFPL